MIGLFAERRLAALLAAGALDEAVAALGEVPGGLAALAGGARPEGESEAAAELVAEVGGLPVTGRQEDLRLELAALGWLAGDLDSARRLLDSAPAAEPEDEDPLEGTGPTRAVVDRLLGTQAGDPFDLFFGLAMASVGANWDEPVNALALRLAAAALAEGEG